MFKKLRDKISEEVQHTSLRLPASVQQITQQFTGPGAVGPGGLSTEHPSFDAAAAGSLQDELLVDISGIQPAGDNKDLFSIDEESLEGSPIKSNNNNMTTPSTLEVIDLQSDEDRSPNPAQRHQSQAAASVSNLNSGRVASGGVSSASTVEGLTFDPSSPTPSTPLSPLSPSHPGEHGGAGVAVGGRGYSRSFSGRQRRDSMDSNVSEVSTTSGLFRINEVPGSGFSIPQSDLESASEWEEGSMSGGITDKITKDVLYQAYVKMRQRYHKYKGRYADVVRAYRDKERETEKLRDVLAKTQDKAVRRVRLLQEGYGSVATMQSANARNGNNNNNNNNNGDNSISKSCVSLDSGLAGPAWEDTAEGEGAAPTPPASAVIKAPTPPEFDNDSNSSYRDGGAAGSITSTAKGDPDNNNSNTSNCGNVASVPAVDRSSLDVGGAEGGGASSDGDNVSVVSLGSVSTHTAVSVAASGVSSYSQLQADEIIDKLKGEVSQHKQLLARCMENIRSNKDKLAALTMQRDSLAAQLTVKTDQMAAMTTQHGEELEELRHSMESSSLSMAETKQHLFQELQRKEEEVERLTEENRELAGKVLTLEEATTAQSLGSAGQDPSSQPQSLNANEVEDEATSLEREAIRLAAQLCLDQHEEPQQKAVTEEQLAQSQPSAESRLQEALTTNEALTEDMETMRAERKKLDVRIDDLGEKNRQSEELVSQLTDDCAEMEAKLTSMEKKNEKLKAELDNMNGSYNELQVIVQGHVSQKNELNCTVKEQEAKLKKAQGDKVSLERKCEEVVAELKELERGLEQTVSEKEDVVGQLGSLSKEKEMVAQRLVEMEEMKKRLDEQLMASLLEKETLGNENAQLKNLVEEKTQKAVEANEKMSELSQQIEEISNQRLKQEEGHQELLTKWEAVSSDLAAFEDNYAKLEKDLSNSKTRCEELESQYTSLTQAHSEASQSTLSFEEQVKELQKANAELSSSSLTLQSNNKQLQADLERAQAEKCDVEKGRDEVNMELQKLITIRAQMEEELSVLKDRSSALLKEKEDISTLKESIERERDELRGKFSNEKEAKEESDRRVVELEEQINLAKQKEYGMNDLNDQLKKRVTELEGELQKNEEECKEGEAATREWKDKWRILEEDNKRLRENVEIVENLNEEKCQLSTRTGELEKEIDSLTLKLNSKDQEIVQIQEQISVKDNEMESLLQSLSEKEEDVMKVRKDLSEQLSSKLKELEKCGQTIQDLNTRLWALLEEMDRQKNTMAEVENKARAAQQNCDELSDEVQKLRALVEEKDGNLAELRAEKETELTTQTQSLEELETQLAEKTYSLLKLQNVLSSREVQLKEVTDEKLKVDNQLRELTEAKNRLDDELRELTNAKTRLDDELRKRIESLKAQSQELELLKEQLNELKEEVKGKQDELDVAKSEVVGAGNDCLILEEKVKNLMNVLEEREEEVENVQEASTKLSDENERLKSERAASLSEEHQKSERLEQSGRELTACLQERERELASCKEQLDHLKQQLTAQTEEQQVRVLECTNKVDATNKALLEKESELEKVQSEVSRLTSSQAEHEWHALNKSYECRCLLDLISDKEAKIQDLLQEKQEFLSSYDSKVGELDDLLNKEKTLLKTTKESYEEKVASLEEDLARSEELYKNQVSNIVQDKQALSKRLSDQENEFKQQEKTWQQKVVNLEERAKTLEETQSSSQQLRLLPSTATGSQTSRDSALAVILEQNCSTAVQSLQQLAQPCKLENTTKQALDLFIREWFAGMDSEASGAAGTMSEAQDPTGNDLLASERDALTVANLQRRIPENSEEGSIFSNLQPQLSGDPSGTVVDNTLTINEIPDMSFTVPEDEDNESLSSSANTALFVPQITVCDDDIEEFEGGILAASGPMSGGEGGLKQEQDPLIYPVDGHLRRSSLAFAAFFRPTFTFSDRSVTSPTVTTTASRLSSSGGEDPNDSSDAVLLEGEVVTAVRKVQQGLSAVAPGPSAASDLAAENARLRTSIARLEQERTNASKQVAMLELNAEHNKTKVKNMEVSNTDMINKLAAMKAELNERDKSEVEQQQQLLDKMKELDSRLTKEKEDIAAQMMLQKSEYEKRLLTERGELQNKYEEDVKKLREEVQALEDVKQGYLKQVEQIEANNAEMQAKMAAVQDARDRALEEVQQAARDKDQLSCSLGELQALKLSLDQQILKLTEEKTGFETRLQEEAKRVTDLTERTSQLQQTETELRKQVVEMTSSKEQLANEVSTLTAGKQEATTCLNEQKAQCEGLRSDLAETKERFAVLSAAESELRRDIERLNKESEERPAAAAESKAKDDRIEALESELKRAEEDLARRTTEARTSADHQYQQQLKSLAAEYDSRLAETAAAAAESGGEVSGLRSALVASQEEAREKADALDSLQHTRAQETTLSSLRSEHRNSESAVRSEAEALVRSVEAAWRTRADKLLRQREQQLREEMDGLQQEWNKERKELERLTGVAAAAFRSGTDSVELLRTQVQQQREELQHIKHQHQLEVIELRALLDVKQRRRQEGGSGVRLGGTLEDAAEFEYLKNVLYQYMMGKETQTLAKVLCAVLKFDQQQQQEIVAFQQSQSATLETPSSEASLEPTTVTADSS